MMTSPTGPQRDAHAVAKLLISYYGVQAGTYAAHQALKARERGDQRLVQKWRWIVGAVEEVLRAPPDDDEGAPRPEEQSG